MEREYPALAPDEMRSILGELSQSAPEEPFTTLLLCGVALECWVAGLRLAAIHPLLLLLAVPLLGFSLTQLSIVVHDCAHGSLFSSARANTVAGFAAGLLCWTPFFSFRRGHHAHHRWLGAVEEKDPTPSPRGEVSPNRLRDWIFRIRLFPVMFWTGVFVPYLLYDLRPTAGPRTAGHLLSYAVTLALTVLLHIGLALWMGPGTYLLVALPGFLLWGILYENLFTLNQHVGLLPVPEGKNSYSYREQVNLSRSVRLPASVFFFHFNLHKEHHLAPSLPYQALPELHRILRRRRPDVYEFTDGDVGFFRRRRRRSHEILTPTAGDRPARRTA